MSKWNARVFDHRNLVCDDGGRCLAECEYAETAETIVREHNSHATLLEITKACRDQLMPNPGDPYCTPEVADVASRIAGAIKAAEVT